MLQKVQSYAAIHDYATSSAYRQYRNICVGSCWLVHSPNNHFTSATPPVNIFIVVVLV